jgi:trans-aconitate methyltransferase
MDAGSGSGNLTQVLADIVPDGYVYAVDADPNMVLQAKSNLSSYPNVEVIHSSMDNVNLPRKVDVIFSNSAIHWILDQKSLFSHFWQLLKPYGGELLIECDGYGNLEKEADIAFKIMQSDQFKGYFANWTQSWYFPKPEDTKRLLQKIGFRDSQIYLSNQTITFPNLECFRLFAKTVITKPFLNYFHDDDGKKHHFVEGFIDELRRTVCGRTWSLDFVRLNILARNF